MGETVDILDGADRQPHRSWGGGHTWSCSFLLPSLAPSFVSALFSETCSSCQVSPCTGNPEDPGSMVIRSESGECRPCLPDMITVMSRGWQHKQNIQSLTSEGVNPSSSFLALCPEDNNNNTEIVFCYCFLSTCQHQVLTEALPIYFPT